MEDVRARTGRVGVLGGARAFLGGVGFVVTTPGVWGWAAVPVGVATLLFGLGSVGAVAGASAIAERVVGGEAAATGTVVGAWALRLLLSLAGLVVAFVVATSLAQPLSGFALDAIAKKQEIALGGRGWPDAPFLAGVVRSLRVSLTALAIALPILGVLALVGFLVPPAAVVTVPLQLVVTGLVAAYDFLDYPLSLRGYGVRERLAFMRRHAGAMVGFGVVAGLVLLVPGVGLFLLPFGVAGAARLVHSTGVDHV